jgi:hypothetical protein
VKAIALSSAMLRVPSIRFPLRDAMRARRTTGSGNFRISISAIAMKGALIYSFGHDARP